jgi:hypothetical protein
MQGLKRKIGAVTSRLLCSLVYVEPAPLTIAPVKAPTIPAGDDQVTKEYSPVLVANAIRRSKIQRIGDFIDIDPVSS